MLSSFNHASSKPGSREPGFFCSSQSAFLRIYPLPVFPILRLLRSSRKRAGSRRSRTAAMSLGTDGKGIRCDGKDCQAAASLPVALHARLLPLHLRAAPADGWLIISSTVSSRHFCPHCASMQLECMEAFDSRKETRLQDRQEEDKTTEGCYCEVIGCSERAAWKLREPHMPCEDYLCTPHLEQLRIRAPQQANEYVSAPADGSKNIFSVSVRHRTVA